MSQGLGNKRNRRFRVIALTAGVILLALVMVLIRYRDLAFSKLNINVANEDSAALLGLRQIAEVPLDGGASRFDYQSVDEGHHRLYIARLGAGQVTVFDLRNQQVITDIVDVAGVHGVLAVPELGRVFATATGSRQVVVIDAETFQTSALGALTWAAMSGTRNMTRPAIRSSPRRSPARNSS